MTTKAQQSVMDNALVAQENQHVISKCNMRINPGIKPKEPTYLVVLDALALTTCYLAFLITAEVPVIYMHQFWATVNKHKASYRFKIGNKSFLGTMRFVSRHEDTQVYGDILPESMTNQAMQDSKPKTKSDSAISSKETPSKKKPTKANKDIPSKKKPASKPKLTKKKASVKADRGKGLNVLSKVALSEVAQLKEATKRSKKDFYISQASGSGDGTDFESRVSDEQQRKTSGADEGTGTKPEVLDVPKYDSKSDKESWGDSGEEDNDDDDKDDTEDDDDNDGNDDDDSDHEGLNLKMTDPEQDGADLHNAHVTLTTVHDTLKIDGSMQSSSVSSDFTEKLLNFKNVFPPDNEIASLMDTTNQEFNTGNNNEQPEDEAAPKNDCDDTLNDVRTTLHDITSGIRMEYLPKKKWSELDKRRAHVMIQDIKKQLFQIRLMRNLAKFVGEKEYGNDLRLLEQTI
nr:hypothetical protein [Tanacetum cinerariifolium]